MLNLYFFVKDKIDQGKMIVEHCPTDQMWTDINTMPNQGIYNHCTFCSHVMGIPVNYRDKDVASGGCFLPSNWVPKLVLMLPILKDQIASQECVGDKGEQLEPTNARRNI